MLEKSGPIYLTTNHRESQIYDYTPLSDVQLDLDMLNLENGGHVAYHLILIVCTRTAHLLEDFFYWMESLSKGIKFCPFCDY